MTVHSYFPKSKVDVKFLVEFTNKYRYGALNINVYDYQTISQFCLICFMQINTLLALRMHAEIEGRLKTSKAEPEQWYISPLPVIAVGIYSFPMVPRLP